MTYDSKLATLRERLATAYTASSKRYYSNKIQELKATNPAEIALQKERKEAKQEQARINNDIATREFLEELNF